MHDIAKFVNGKRRTVADVDEANLVFIDLLRGKYK